MTRGSRNSGRGSLGHFRLGDEHVITSAGRLVRYAQSLVLGLAGAALFFLTLGDVLHSDGIAAVDKPLTNWFIGNRTVWASAVMTVLATVFGPIVLPVITLLVTATWSLLTRLLWRPLLLAGTMITGVVLTEIIAHVVSRPRPPSALMMLGPDPTSSFPSGHVMGASNFLLLGAYLVSRDAKAFSRLAAFIAALGGLMAEAASRLYLGYHWFTDTVGSVSLSMVLLAAVTAFDTSRARVVPGPAGHQGSAPRDSELVP